jgi:hypothetical protein
VKQTPAWEVMSSKEATIQGGLEHGSRGTAIARSHYQATTSEGTAGWERLSMCSSDSSE